MNTTILPLISCLALGHPVSAPGLWTAVRLVLVLLLLGLLGIGLFFIQRYFAVLDRGNGFRYRVTAAPVREDSPLRGVRFLVLGFSVTMGMTSYGVSCVEYLCRRNGCSMKKDAVLASTLADRTPFSYVRRLRKHTAETDQIDFFLCQLSTNDAVFHSDLGRISPSDNPEAFDLQTSAGGIEFIIDYVKRTWNCPVIFFTGTKFDNPRYRKLVNILLSAQDKWGIEVIDLWNDPEMNAVTPEEYRLYMHDGVHPTRAGYMLWWTPRLEEELCRIVMANRTPKEPGVFQGTLPLDTSLQRF